MVARSVGAGRRTHKSKPHTGIVNVVAVLTVVEKADAVAALGKICPLVCGNLKTGVIKACVPVCRAFDCTVSDVVGSLRVNNRNVELCLKHLVALVPVNGCVEQEHIAAAVEDDLLCDCGFVELAHDFDYAALCVGFEHLNALCLVKSPHLFLVVDFKVPRSFVNTLVKRNCEEVTLAVK